MPEQIWMYGVSFESKDQIPKHKCSRIFCVYNNSKNVDTFKLCVKMNQLPTSTFWRRNPTWGGHDGSANAY